MNTDINFHVGMYNCWNCGEEVGAYQTKCEECGSTQCLVIPVPVIDDQHLYAGTGRDDYGSLE